MLSSYKKREYWRKYERESGIPAYIQNLCPKCATAKAREIGEMLTSYGKEHYRLSALPLE